MQILSKLVDRVFMPDWSFRYNCYEVAHTWDPSCTSANVDIGIIVFYEALRMYGSLSIAQMIYQLFLERQKSIYKLKKAAEEKQTKMNKKKTVTENENINLLEEQNNNYLISSETIKTIDKNSSHSTDGKVNNRKKVHFVSFENKQTSKAICEIDTIQKEQEQQEQQEQEEEENQQKKSNNELQMWGPWEKEKVMQILKFSIQSWLRSSAFLGFNAYVMFSFFCLCRKVTGKFYYRLISVFPATVGCLLAIHIERPSRRNALAVYVANVASEVLFRMGQSRGYYDGLGDPGIALIFSLSVAYLAYRVKHRGFGRDPTSILLKLLLGKGEAPIVRRLSNRHKSDSNDRRPLNNTLAVESKPSQLVVGENRLQNQLNNNKQQRDSRSARRLTVLSQTYQQLTKWLQFSLKHPTCRHDEANCLLYSAQGFVLPFVVGYIGPALLRSLLNPSKFAAAPMSTIWRQLSNGRSVNIALFLGLFSGGFRAGCCALRWATGSSSDWHVFASAAVAGMACLKSPNSTMATYFLWKAIESCYVDFYKKGYLPNPLYVAPLLYAISVNTIFYAGILEPYNVRPSYAKFIERVTQNRIHLINRSLLAVFGTNAFIGFEEFWPDLDPRLCSNEFMETVLLWKLGDK